MPTTFAVVIVSTLSPPHVDNISSLPAHTLTINDVPPFAPLSVSPPLSAFAKVAFTFGAMVFTLVGGWNELSEPPATLAPLTPNKKTVVFALQTLQPAQVLSLAGYFLPIPIIPNLPAPVLVNVLKAM
jgi:hypothetical protein